MERTTCPQYQRCGRTGHYLVEGVWTRCSCLMKEIHRRKLGVMYCPEPNMNTKLIKEADKDMLLEGPLDSLRPHVAGVLLTLAAKNVSYVVLDAYRLIEIFLEKDPEFASTAEAVNADLLIMLLGFADPPNKYLPELLTQTYARRNMMLKPTWTILGLEQARIAGKYSEEVFSRLNKMKKAKIDK